MKCSVKGCDNNLPAEPQEFNIVTPDFDTRRVKVCDECYENHTKAEGPLYIPLKEGA
jgi:hypothetical protein